MTVPDRIMDEARKIATASFVQNTVAHDVLRANIAQALLAAEKRGREEAAKIAETAGVYPELNIFGGGPEWYRHGKRIAAAIRSTN